MPDTYHRGWSMARTPTTPFRLEAGTLASLDRIAAHLASLTGSPSSRAAALRWAVKEAVSLLPKKFPKKAPKGIHSVDTGG
jgi:hypothetical protein